MRITKVITRLIIGGAQEKHGSASVLDFASEPVKRAISPVQQKPWRVRWKLLRKSSPALTLAPQLGEFHYP